MLRMIFPQLLAGEDLLLGGFARLCRPHPRLLPERPQQAMQPMPKGILVFMFQPKACMTNHAPGLKHKNRSLSRPAAFACGERGILIIISLCSVIYQKYIDNLHIKHHIILPYIVIFRIKMGDYLGDYTENPYICANILSLIYGHCA